MADTVRYLMEEMVPELEDMVKQQYFSRAEVKQIVKRRQDFEYLLKRKATLKEDYLRYIEYESKLDALRVHRRQALGVEGKKKKSLADFAIVRRIHFIFERAVRKFKTDLSLWTAWLEFCRASNSNRRLGRVVARALQIHPTEPGLWVYAAAWEFEANANPSAARALMQQGLRMCRYSEKMWLDYFDLELMYVEKLVARRRILGLDVPDPDAAVAADTDNNNNQQENEQEPAAATGRKRRRGADADADADAAGGDAAGEADAAEDGEGPESKADAAAAAAAAAGQPTLNQVLASQQEQQQEQQQGTGLADAQAAVNAVLTGAVARLVYQQALKAAAAAATKGAVSSNYLKPQLGSSGSSNSGGLQFRAGFLRVLQQYSSPGVGQLRREVVDSIRQDFPQDPAAADLLARLACDPTDVSASTQDFHAAVQEYERLLGGRSFLQQQPPADAAAGAGTAGKSSSSKGRQASKRQKKAPAHEQEQQEQHEQDATAGVQVPAEVLPQVYRLYCAFLEQRMQALLQHEEHALSAAAVAQQLFKLLLAAHTAGAADEELYGTWVRLATQLQQHKVALKAARLATEAHPSSGRAWEMRVEQESLSLLGCSIDSLCEQQQQPEQQSTQQQQQQQHQQQLFVLVMQALRQVPAAAAVQLWQQGLALAELLARAQQQHTTKQATDSEGSSSSSSSCPQQLAALQKLLVGAVTAASVRGPSTGGLGEVAGRCLQAIWRVCGAAAARKLWQQLLLLPPAGGDMFRAMLGLEQQSAGAGGGGGGGVGGEQRVAAVLAADAVKRVRGVFEAWASAYGSCDAELWVEWALFEQQQGKAGAGKIYWRAVKALDEPDVFIADYRQRIGAAA